MDEASRGQGDLVLGRAAAEDERQPQHAGSLVSVPVGAQPCRDAAGATPGARRRSLVVRRVGSAALTTARVPGGREAVDQPSSARASPGRRQLADARGRRRATSQIAAAQELQSRSADREQRTRGTRVARRRSPSPVRMRRSAAAVSYSSASL